jgi:hypothetical protein
VLREIYHQLQTSEMDELFGLSTGKTRFSNILERAKTVHGELADHILPVSEEHERQVDIINRRQTITTEEHRFFLALLLNIPDREKVLQLVKERYPAQDPIETVLDWVEQLGRTRVLGSKETNALGLPEFDDNYVFVFECLLQGLNENEIIDRARAEYPAESAAELITIIPAIRQTLKDSTLFKSLLNS